MELEFYAARVSNIGDAAQRNRFIFAVSIVIAIAIFGATWNSAPPGLYQFAQGMWEHDLAPLSGTAQTNATRELQIELLKGWVQSLFVNFPLLGVRFSVNDSATLGTFALFVISLWKFYGARRENHLIGGLLRDTVDAPSQVKGYVFHGICGTQVFATLTNDDSPISSIRGGKVRTTPAIRPLARMLNYLPTIVSFAIVGADLASFFWWPAPFRTSHASIYQSLLPGDVNRELFTLFATDGIAVFFTTMTTILSWKSAQYQDGSIKILREVALEGWGQPQPILTATASL